MCKCVLPPESVCSRQGRLKQMGMNGFTCNTSVCAYACARAQTRTHTHTHTHILTNTDTQTHRHHTHRHHTHTHILTNEHTLTYTRTHTHTHIHAHAQLYLQQLLRLSFLDTCIRRGVVQGIGQQGICLRAPHRRVNTCEGSHMFDCL